MKSNKNYHYIYVYLDASALIKLILDIPDEKPGHKEINEFFINNPGPFFTTSLCFSETLGTLKRKFLKKEISIDKYLNSAEKLFINVSGPSPKIKIDNKLPIDSKELFENAAKLVNNYKIDLIDAMQIMTVMKGIYYVLVEKNKPLFITADKDLAEAARKESMQNVWDCIGEPKPK